LNASEQPQGRSLELRAAAFLARVWPLELMEQVRHQIRAAPPLRPVAPLHTHRRF